MNSTISIEISSMKAEDYNQVIKLWQRSEGIGLSDSDSEESIKQFLHRNPGLSRVAALNGKLVGAIMCGHDGRRGYIHHLAVSSQHKRQGLGRALVESCLNELKAVGIQKCHLFVFVENEDARAFWRHVDWTERDELVMVSKYL